MTTEHFHWTSPSGVEITLPHMARLKAGLLRRVRRLDPVDASFTMLEEVADEANMAKIDDLQIEDLNALATAWQEASANLGESGPSST